MDEQFDNELRDRIREVFDNFEDPTADDGWMLLREKFPEERKRRAIAWIWWGAAAGLLLFLGIGLWINYSNNQTVKLAIKTPKHKQSETIAATHNSIDTAHAAKPLTAQAPVKATAGDSKESNPSTVPHLTTINNHVKPVKQPGLLNDTSLNKAFITKNTGKKHSVNGKTPVNQLVVTPKANTNQPNNAAGAKQPAVIVQQGNAVKNQPVTNGQQVLAVSPNKPGQKQSTMTGQQTLTTVPDKSLQNKLPSADDPLTPLQPKAVTPNQVIAVTPPAKKTINDMFNQSIVKDKEKDKEVKMKTKKVVFGVYAGTFFNYAKGSDNEVNAGAGFTADIKLTDNLRLLTGVTIAQNSLSYNSTVYNSGIPVAAVQPGGFLAASLPSASGASNFYGGAASNDLSPAASPTLKNYNASLVGLDIPLDLKYEFNSQKNNAYLLFGFSSGTFINEAYTYQYNYPIVNSASLQQTQNQTTHSSFNSFYVAKTLNAAFGIGLPFGKNHLIVEPFFKYPLEGLGSQQIRFGSGGLNLKFNFQPALSRKLKD